MMLLSHRAEVSTLSRDQTIPLSALRLSQGCSPSPVLNISFHAISSGEQSIVK